ncbi:hypothetical protein ACFQ0O_31495 [Saccharopolyspora spinosporotrichia]|uniref:Uncharacterized protein n=2 Tax=Saccharopolyspora erythraea TaxID=1836 RepID=A4FML3_SACEN|nr:hypothetical protein N599_14325 [Saccharopolyspora erythraea D]CAM05288.1 hypothetical protein SACE_6115 [Saccharopolyspora erythraea NRRL 2338]
MSRRAADLDRLAASVTPESLTTVLPEALRALGEPTGDLEALEDLVHAFNRGEREAQAVQSEAANVATKQVSAVWTGRAAESATAGLVSLAKRIDADAGTFTAAEQILSRTADALRDSHRRHLELRQYLIDLENQASTLPEGTSTPAAADLANRAAQALRDGSRLINTTREAEESAAAKFRAFTEGGAFGTMAFLAAASGDTREPIEEISKEYQVSPDPDGMSRSPTDLSGGSLSNSGSSRRR